MEDALLELEKGKETAPDRKGAANPQGKPQLSGMKELEFQRQARYCSRRGAPNTRL